MEDITDHSKEIEQRELGLFNNVILKHEPLGVQERYGRLLIQERHERAQALPEHERNKQHISVSVEDRNALLEKARQGIDADYKPEEKHADESPITQGYTQAAHIADAMDAKED